MVTRWIHVQSREFAGDPWVLPIRNAINEAEQDGRITGPTENELGLHISRKLTMLPYVIKRVDKGSQEVYRKIQNCSEQHISTKVKRDDDVDVYVFDLKDDRLLNGLLIDIDSLLFEFKSCEEFLTKYLEWVYGLVGINRDERNWHEELESIIRAAVDGEVENHTAWLKKLKDHRGFFTHDAAPYIAVDITKSSSPELIIMRKNIINFDEADREEYIRLSEIHEIVEGFVKAKTILQAHLIKVVNDCGSPRSAGGARA